VFPSPPAPPPYTQVEPIALLANAPETGFVGVYMYCDDQATLKHLPINQRATAIAAAAGQALEVRGGRGLDPWRRHPRGGGGGAVWPGA